MKIQSYRNIIITLKTILFILFRLTSYYNVIVPPFSLQGIIIYLMRHSKSSCWHDVLQPLDISGIFLEDYNPIINKQTNINKSHNKNIQVRMLTLIEFYHPETCALLSWLTMFAVGHLIFLLGWLHIFAIIILPFVFD